MLRRGGELRRDLPTPPRVHPERVLDERPGPLASNLAGWLTSLQTLKYSTFLLRFVVKLPAGRRDLGQPLTNASGGPLDRRPPRAVGLSHVDDGREESLDGEAHAERGRPVLLQPRGAREDGAPRQPPRVRGARMPPCPPDSRSTATSSTTGSPARARIAASRTPTSTSTGSAARARRPRACRAAARARRALLPRLQHERGGPPRPPEAAPRRPGHLSQGPTFQYKSGIERPRRRRKTSSGRVWETRPQEMYCLEFPGPRPVWLAGWLASGGPLHSRTALHARFSHSLADTRRPRCPARRACAPGGPAATKVLEGIPWEAPSRIFGADRRRERRARQR